MPSIAGLDDFGGHVFHSARWDHSVELAGRRIAIVGNGSTGVQLVCGLAGVAGRVVLFQRTAQWVLKLPNPATPGWPASPATGFRGWTGWRTAATARCSTSSRWG